MKQMLFFDKMVTPKIITFVYWLLLLVSIVGGVVAMFGVGFFVGLISAIVGVVASRIWCELLIIFFKMNEALQELRHK